MVESSSRHTEPLVPVPASGRIFRGQRQVRLGDVRPSGDLRLDALTRYTQDVSNDDTTDAALPDDLAWVVRRTVVDVFSEATFGEHLTFVTFCSGLGRRWAERRLHVTGKGGAHYDVATLWIHVDPATGRPRRVGEAFNERYAEAAQGRKVGARLTHPDLPPHGAASEPWPLRAVDFDLFDHVNNAAYWAVLEEHRLRWQKGPGPFRLEVEYRAGIEPGNLVEVWDDGSGEGTHRWWWMTGTADDAASCVATARVLTPAENEPSEPLSSSTRRGRRPTAGSERVRRCSP